MALRGQIAIVTGASRGIGQGIALQLGEAGATVYVTGRKPGQSDASKENGLPSLDQTAKEFKLPDEDESGMVVDRGEKYLLEILPFAEITDRGGRGIAVYVDHANMDEVKSFFSRIESETNGQLDILVNNAFAAANDIISSKKTKFYDGEPELWDLYNNVGLRNHYYCAVYASRMMVKKRKGLIVNVSSPGGITYLYNVSYGVGKQALDRMAVDMGVELKSDGVSSISLWPGAVSTQMVQQSQSAPKYSDYESIEYSGKAIVALASDTNIIGKSGRILTTVDLGDEYGFVDIDGRRPANIRSVSYLLNHAGWKKTSEFIPGWLKCPGWMMVAACSNL